jgi:hypothetical protein
MASAVTATVVVWALLGTRVGDPHRIPLVLLIGLVLALASLPALAWVSRRCRGRLAELTHLRERSRLAPTSALRITRPTRTRTAR